MRVGILILVLAMAAVMASVTGAPVLAPVVASAQDEIATMPPSPGIPTVDWLRGCWRSAAEDTFWFERWTPLGMSVFGVSAVVVEDTILARWKVVLISGEEDELEYEIHVSGRRTAVFKSTTVEDSKVVFENTRNEYPKEIGYELQAPDTLLAWMEGKLKGKVQKIEWRYWRVVCPDM